MTAHAPTITLETIKDRCHEVADCWLWKNATSDGGYPIVKVRGCGCRLVRRLVLDFVGTPAMPRQPVVTTCGEKLCVNPAHLKASTTAAVSQAAAAKVRFPGWPVPQRSPPSSAPNLQSWTWRRPARSD